MERMSLRADSEDLIRKIPERWGVLGFWKCEELLYLAHTSDLQRKLSRMLSSKDPVTPLRELIEEADSVGFEDHPDGVSALIAYKVKMLGEPPLYNNRILQSQDYVYLALDAHRFPFIGVQDYTVGDWVYLGPFRSRFQLMDVIDTFSRILLLPHCDTGQYPCHRQGSTCKGWCLNLDAEEGKAKAGENTLDRLEHLIKEVYLYPQDAIINTLRGKRKRLFDELEFELCEGIDVELGLVGEYYDWLRFLHRAKALSFETASIGVDSGQLSWAEHKGKVYHFPVSHPEYRPNELLALAKEIVDESRILYEYKDKLRF